MRREMVAETSLQAPSQSQQMAAETSLQAPSQIQQVVAETSLQAASQIHQGAQHQRVCGTTPGTPRSLGASEGLFEHPR